MKKLFSIMALGTVCLMAASCKFIRVTGPAVEETRQAEKTNKNITMYTRDLPIEEFHSLSFKGFFEIKYVSGETNMQVKGPEDLISQILIDNTDGVLNIALPENKGRRGRKDKIYLYLSSPVLNTVEIKGAADFEAENIVSQDFLINIKGAGDLEIESLKANTVKVLIEGAGDVDIENVYCDDLHAEINGAGDCEVGGYAKVAKAVIKGTGDINFHELHADSFTSEVKGIGDVKSPKK